jgi:ABC-type multidrug transport system fused ATPase/permease subunit
MPVAFFTRTRTGALVSRLNNDVIGAQRAFSDTLSGVAGNVVTLALALGVMLTLSWQVTLLALALLPVFVVPARRIGRRLAQLEREAADHNAAMGNQMTERFSAPGATLVKLFGRPADESREFVSRAARVRDIGVRTAMVQWVFVTALTLVSALALALVYGLGGYLALNGRMAAGRRRRAGPADHPAVRAADGLAGARVEVMSALVSFGRVFEILDLPPLIREPERPQPLPDGPLSVELSHVRFAYPARRRCRWRRLKTSPGSTTAAGSRCCTTCPSGPSRGRRWRWWGRREPASRPSRSCCHGSTTSTPAWCGSAGWTCATCRSTRSATRSGWSRRTGTCSTSRSAATCCWPARGDGGRAVGRAAAGPAGGAGRRAPGRAGHRGRRAGVPAVGR